MPPDDEDLTRGYSKLEDLKSQFERLKQFTEWLEQHRAEIKVEVRFFRVCDDEKFFTYNRPLSDEEVEVMKAPLEAAVMVPGVSTFAKTEILHDGDNTILKVGAYHLRRALPDDPVEETFEGPVVASGEPNAALYADPKWVLSVGDTTIPIKDWKFRPDPTFTTFPMKEKKDGR